MKKKIFPIDTQLDYYYYDKLRIDEIHRLGIKGDNVTIAVLDTGADWKHPLLKDEITFGIDFTSERECTDDYMDMNGHGTGVLGEIVKISPNAKVIVVKIMDRQGRGGYNQIINGIYYAIDQKVDIINMSLGGSINDPQLYKAIKKAHENNISVVCASGNDAKGDLGTIDQILYPAYYNQCIEVGAIDRDLSPCGFSNSNAEMDIVSFGKDIATLYKNGQMQILDGTSQATPIISAFLALILDYQMKKFNKRPSEKELFNLLMKYTTKIPNVLDNQQGNGMLDVDKFINDIKGDRL